MACRHNETKAKLDKLLSNIDILTRSAAATFEQFANTQNDVLHFNEIEELIERLCENLQLPPVDQNTLKSIISRYNNNKHDKECLDFDEFFHMYQDLLQLIQEKYYPTRTMVVRRSCFVHRRRLNNHSITTIFKFLKKLGSGSFGEVHLVLEKLSQQHRVIKVINKRQATLPIHQINAEIEFLKTLDHPNIIKIFEVYEDSNNVYIVQEVCAGGELMERVIRAHQTKTRFSEKHVADIMRRLLEAVTYCHEKKIAHKDLKPENVMFLTQSPHSPIKIIDFGVAEIFKRIDSTSSRAAGTALYMAPEVFQMRLGLKCDIWSLGCIMYLLLTGKLPFIGRTLAEVQHKVSKYQPDFAKDCADVSSGAIEVMQSMLIKDSTIRPSSRRILKHPWFKTAPADTEYLTPEICVNLQRFMRQSHLKNVLVNMLVYQLNVTAPQIQKLANLFRTFDKDGNGVLTMAEMAAGLESAGWKQWDINRIVTALDIDNSGTIDYTACYTWREAEMNVIWSAFNKIDTDGDGKIKTEEFLQVLLGGQFSLIEKSELEEMIRQIDFNGNGTVEWNEFLNYIKDPN